jgi:excisionase family DNA binding protein
MPFRDEREENEKDISALFRNMNVKPPNSYTTATVPAQSRIRKASPAGSLDGKSSVSRLTYTVKETASALGVSEPTVWRMVYERQIPATRVRGRVMIRIQDIEAYLDANKLEDFVDA